MTLVIMTPGTVLGKLHLVYQGCWIAGMDIYYCGRNPSLLITKMKSSQGYPEGTTNWATLIT